MQLKDGQDENIFHLIKFFGSQKAFANKLGLGQGAVSQWLNKKTKMKSENAFLIEKLTNGKFKATELCPRLAEIEQFGKENDQHPKHHH